VSGFLSIGEAVAAVEPLTARQVRYLRFGSVAAAGGGRLYDAEGLALLMLYRDVAARFTAAGLPAWQARAAMLYCEPAIRSAFRRRVSAAVLVLDRARGTASVEPSARGDDDAIRLWPSLVAARRIVEQTRARTPAVWTGRALTTAPELVTA